MLRLIQLLIWGHVHKWTVIYDGDLTGANGARGHRYHLQCEKCGDVKKRDLI